MWILDIIMQHKMIFSSISCILLLNIIFLIRLIIKDRRLDKEEIEELIMDKKVEPTEEETVFDDKVKNNKTDLEQMLEKMQAALETKSEQDVVATFENEQEEKSIISYQELVNSLKTEKPIYVEAKEELMKPVEEVEEGKIPAPIKIDLGEVTKVEIPEIKVKDKFKSTDFISPIYGKQEVKDDYQVIKEFKHTKKDEDVKFNVLDDYVQTKSTLEESLNIEPLREEIKRNDEFLAALKEFRKNLE